MPAAGRDGFENQVNQRLAGSEPEPGEIERRPRDLVHPESVDVEPATRVEVPDDERHVVDLANANHVGGSREGGRQPRRPVILR